MGWHYFMDERYLARNPKLAVPSLRRMLNNEPDKLRIYPVSSGVRRLNWPDAVNTLTSGCNAMPYRDTLFGEEYTHSFFICEPANNLVHREVLEPDGISFRSHRAADEQGIEFLASEDNWSRFTQARTGPDGCLYVVDMYRQVIEHPEWIPNLMLEHMDVRAGEDKGRIYRVTKEGVKPRKVPNLDKLTYGEMAKVLESPNGWARDAAQKLVIELASDITENPADYLQAILTDTLASGSPDISSEFPGPLIQMLWSSHSLGMLDVTQLITALHVSDARVRLQTVRLVERQISDIHLLDEILSLANDPDLRVRVQLALTLGESSDPRVPDVLRSLAKRDGDNPDMLIALLTAYPKHEAALTEDAKQWQAKLKELQKSSSTKAPVQIITNNNPDRDKVVRQYASVATLKGDAEHGHTLYKTICFACHKLKNEGNEIGPDLGTIAGKPTDQIVEAIMDPSRAVEARYLSTTVTLKDGRVVIGMIAEETANSLTLKTASGTEVFLRADIKGREASTKSIMPDGLEGVMKPQDVADVIEWIRAK
jgi:putative heme-binding domain-containing protein